MQTVEAIEVLEDFSCFKKGEVVEVNDANPLTNRKVCERYVTKGRAKWTDKPVEHDAELEEAELTNAGIVAPDDPVKDDETDSLFVSDNEGDEE